MSLLGRLFKNQHVSRDTSVPAQKPTPQIAENIACPHCGTILGKVPVRRAKCPYCNEDIFVRSKQSLFPSTLLTEPQADAVDLVKNFEFLGLSDALFREKQSELSARFKSPASVDDTIWSVFNGLILHLAKSSDFSQLSIIYSQMALFLTKRGKDGSKMAIESNKMSLRDYAKMGVIDFEIVNSVDCCIACKNLGGKKYALNGVLLETPPLPPSDCNCHLWKDKPALCGCSYVAKTFKPFSTNNMPKLTHR